MRERIEGQRPHYQIILQVTALLLLHGCAHTSPDPFTPTVLTEMKSSLLTETKAHDFTCRGLMVEGKREGVWECHNSDGGPRSKITYKRDIKDGPAEFWFENGKPDTYGEWKNGALHGKFRSYRRDGTIHLESTYQEGLIHGNLKEWDENGQLLLDGSYKSGRRHGRLREWYPNGRLKSDGSYQNNQLTAPEKRWDQNGISIPEN